mmetsp:Transcript_8022/g.17366  ORF Transcript_8022/g.17366 Transcript_8022/m.17366 type:complete len:299 (+) Transcript_8022:51-947(+)|eukprot:CAMPEP_0170602246 /NCGR_PEP_ID=MMETSP0224-20130122/18289_1 /TAXON_ID=285029 /ORGANISM="Togula jolla, Strain CCCM 725" /LENGTH=298 /DNA_ID=CAMNT_0010927073 /DNA_START=50 /DNA_END=946 /DNA_ORIENTATION=-
MDKLHGTDVTAGVEAAQSAELPAQQWGPVALVGAGPGDPELLTVKAMKRLQTAEVVLHDNLISEDILALVPEHAVLVNVGKRCGDPKDRGLQQQEIHDLMLIHSQRGRRVVRLKAGDPLVFGRGGEELEFLAQHGISAEVVPGITTALGAAASQLMPLTHRGSATHVRFVVGQSKSRALPDLSWTDLAKDVAGQTVVFYMGMKKIDAICQRLLDEGAAADTPMAVVESATLPSERIAHGTIESLPKMAKALEFGSGGPVIIFLGPTAAFPARLESLAGKGTLKRPRAPSSDDGIQSMA